MLARVVAIDGAAGSGKSTLARRLAIALHVPYVNTGLMYRALAAAALRDGIEVDDADGLLALARGLRFRLGTGSPPELEVEGYVQTDLTSPEVESTVSAVARHPTVRRWMCERQRELGESGAVVEGRDIASVVFPDAVVKLFLRAAPQTRGARRAGERIADRGDVETSLRARDTRDARTNPLEPARDAVVLDTDALDIDQTFRAALDMVRERWDEAGR